MHVFLLSLLLLGIHRIRNVQHHSQGKGFNKGLIRGNWHSMNNVAYASAAQLDGGSSADPIISGTCGEVSTPAVAGNFVTDEDKSNTTTDQDIDHTNELKLLPAPSSANSQTLQLGQSISMDDMGPVIVNTDGSLRRIANWDTLSEQEQRNTLRLIAARNKRRIEQLKKKEAEVSPQSDTASGSPGH